MNRFNLKYLLILLVIAIAVFAVVKLFKLIVGKSKKSAYYMSEPPEKGPYLAVKYMSDGGFLDDAKCGWLDIECEDGGEETVELSFGKKTPNPIFIPLKVAKYRITHRTKSKAGMAASGALRSINASNGRKGSFANAVFDAGVGRAQLSSVVVDTTEDFVIKLGCSTDGFQKNCEILS